VPEAPTAEGAIWSAATLGLRPWHALCSDIGAAGHGGASTPAMRYASRWGHTISLRSRPGGRRFQRCHGLTGDDREEGLSRTRRTLDRIFSIACASSRQPNLPHLHVRAVAPCLTDRRAFPLHTMAADPARRRRSMAGSNATSSPKPCHAPRLSAGAHRRQRGHRS